MGTTIKIKPPNGVEQTVIAYESCTVNESITERAGSFSITLLFLTDTDISQYIMGTNVEINQDGHIFRGWVIKPPKKNLGNVKTVTLEGADYTAKSQKILVTESYTNTAISMIVNDLFTKYVPWATRNHISSNTKPITIRFPDVFLWDAMEQICKLCGYDWFVDQNLDVNFFETANRVNQNIITANAYKQGTAEFTPDASKIVNKLWIKGSKAVSLPFTQNITVSGTTPIALFYTPRVNKDEVITVTVGGVAKTVGIQNIDKAGTKDFLINSNEKLLVPDLCTAGVGMITYRYEYPLKILLEDNISQATYGTYEDIIQVETNDKQIAREFGLKYLKKYSKPVIVGSIEPFDGIYKAGELVKVTIPTLGIDEYLVIKEVSYESVAGLGQVNRKLSLENTQNDLSDILKSMNQRLNKVETALFGSSDNSLVEKYKMYNDDLLVPDLSDTMTYNLHNYMIAGTNIMFGNFTI